MASGVVSPTKPHQSPFLLPHKKSTTPSQQDYAFVLGIQENGIVPFAGYFTFKPRNTPTSGSFSAKKKPV